MRLDAGKNFWRLISAALFAAVISPHGDESPFPACPGKEHYGSAKLAGRRGGLSLIFIVSGLRDLSESTPEP